MFYLKYVVLEISRRVLWLDIEETPPEDVSAEVTDESAAVAGLADVAKTGKVDENAAKESLADVAKTGKVDENAAKESLADIVKTGMGQENAVPENIEKAWEAWRLRLAGKNITILWENQAELRNQAGPITATLWITDDPAAARRHLEKGEAVMGFLHRDNAGEGFEGITYLGMHLTAMEPEDLERIYRRQAGIPWDVLETERCLLRETDEGDVDALYGVYGDPSVTQYLEGLPQDHQELAAQLQDYARNVYAFYGYGIWSVCLKETGEVIGRAGLSHREGFGEPELGFVIGVPWQGRGLAEEVCRAVLAYGREELGLMEVIAFAAPENAASRRLLEKLGFSQEEEVLLSGKIRLKYRKPVPA